MSSLYHPRLSQRFATALGLASALILTTSGPVTVAAAQTDAGERSQKLEELRNVNADAQRKAHEQRVQMDELQAESIDRGLLLTLDDGVFTTNDASLSSSGHRRLETLAAFLEQQPKRVVTIYGYGGAGDYRYDQALSKRRADAVKAYLIGQDIAPSRLTVHGTSKVLNDDEDSATAQQALRRVEVIIEDPSTSLPQPM